MTVRWAPQSRTHILKTWPVLLRPTMPHGLCRGRQYDMTQNNSRKDQRKRTKTYSPAVGALHTSEEVLEEGQDAEWRKYPNPGNDIISGMQAGR